MSFSLTIQPFETMRVYGVNSQNGYVINSDKIIKKNDKTIITIILGAFVNLSLRKDSMPIREKKFNDYVAHKPESEWEEIAEYQLYKNAVQNLKNAQQNFLSIQDQYEVTSIEELICS